MTIENRLYDASLSGDVESLSKLMQEDQLTLARLSITCFNETPLHVSAMLGHLGFVKALVRYKPDLVRKQDSLGRSPLHLASANGYVEIVKTLLMVDSDVCLVKDEDKRTPLHLAVMHGRVDIVTELVRAKPEVITQCKNILHSCVVYNRLEALNVVLVEMKAVDDFVNIKGEKGDTILHTAAALRQIETIRFLLNRTEVRVNALNGSGLTPLDVVESMQRDLKTVEILGLLINSGAIRGQSIPATNRVISRKFNDPYEKAASFVDRALATDNPLKVKVEELPTPSQSSVVKKFLNKKHSWLKRKHKTIKTNLKKEHSWVEKKRDSLMVAATVIAAMTYQAALNPPGGVWPEDDQNNPNAVAGTSILAANDPFIYTQFWVNNTLSFAAALSIILLLVSGVPLKRRIFMWVLMVTMWLTLTFMALTYCKSMQAITPKTQVFREEWVAIIELIAMLLQGWLLLIGIVVVVHTCRVVLWIINKAYGFRKRRNANKRDKSTLKPCNRVSCICLVEK